MRLWLSRWRGRRVGGADGSGLAKPAVLESEPLLGSNYNPEGIRGDLLLLDRIEKLHLLEEMVCCLDSPWKERIRLRPFELSPPPLTLDCCDLGGILFCQVLASQRYLTLCCVCGLHPAEDGLVKMPEGGTN